MAAPNLTSARRQGLEVLVAAGGRGRRSNSTLLAAGPVAYIYWQTADWLVKEGLAYHPRGHTGHEYVELSAAGRRLVDELGPLAPAPTHDRPETENDPDEPGRSPSGRSSVEGPAGRPPREGLRHRCGYCGTQLAHKATGRPRRYCSARCRKGAQRDRDWARSYAVEPGATRSQNDAEAA